MPPGYLVREELDGLCAAILDDRCAAVGVTGQVSGLGLAGQGGIGKTVLATVLARDTRVAGSFPDGVFWVSLGENADPLAAQRNLLTRLGMTATDVRSVTQGARALRETLAQRQCLLIVDDVWSTAAAKALAVTGPRGRVLYTTRDPGVLDAVGARIEHIDVLSEDLARRLLAQLSCTRVEKFPAELDRSGRIFGAHPYANTFKALQTALVGLTAEDTELYLSLAVYPADTQVPCTTISRYWQQLRGYTTEQTQAQLREFASRQLLSFDAEHIGFYDLQHDYLLLQVDDLDLRHADLLDAYRDLLPARDEWWQLPPDEPYLWDHLIHHLHGAGETAELLRTTTDPAYLITRTFLHGPAAAEADLRRTADLLTHPALDWWQQWFGHYGHLLATASEDGTVKIWAQNAVIRTIKLGLAARNLCWHNDLLGVAVDSSVVVLRITGTLGR